MYLCGCGYPFMPVTAIFWKYNFIIFTMNFYFTIAGSDGAGTLTVGRQAITLNSSTFKELNDTETADSGIMQQVAAEIASASVVIT